MSVPTEAIAVSIVVIAYRQREPLVECLRSCAEAAANVAGETELIVVDNGELGDFVRGCGVPARLIEPRQNLGFAGGVSRALRDARGEWVALVNDDARIERDSLRRMLAAGEADRGIGSIATQVRFDADPRLVNSAGILVDSLGVAAERLAGSDVRDAEQQQEVFGPSGCFALYRKTMLDELGGFDERFFAYLEDVDLAWRARAAGWRCVYEPRAVAYHRGSASSGEGSKVKYFLVGRNRVRLLARNATNRQLLRALPGVVLYDLAYIAYVSVSDHTIAPLRGRLAGLRDWSSFRREAVRSRQPVALGSAYRGWHAALRQHTSYKKHGART